MACSARRAAGFCPSVLDGGVGGLFYALGAAHGDRNGVRVGSTDCPPCRTRHVRTSSSQGNKMGTRFARPGPDYLDAAECQRVSVELSLAAVSACDSCA